MKTSQPVALITGAARRVGKAFAQHLAAKGWNIAVHYNSSEQDAVALANELSGQYGNQQFIVVKADLAVEEEVATLFPQVTAKMGEPALLINNASLFKPSTLAATTSPLLEQTLQVNFKAPFQLMRDFYMLCGKGNIVNLADTRITTNHSGYAAYTLSKKMLWEATKMAALEFGPAIRVNAIAPGLTLPPEEKNMSYLEDLAKHIAMKRPGGVDPLLKALDYILGNDYLTGQMLFCDGGENLGKKA
jgi:NAD(P)-dependent dehydrogenase (short-subunit alcohol dehydrogenase family)